jgi:four helix bundle protein
MKIHDDSGAQDGSRTTADRFAVTTTEHGTCKVSHAARQGELQHRTMTFAVRVMRLCRHLNDIPGEGWAIRDQMVRCGTAVAANYRAACRARSKAEFAAKLGVVVEETDETIFWMELLISAGTMTEPKLRSLMSEGRELLNIFAAARKTTVSQLRQR